MDEEKERSTCACSHADRQKEIKEKLEDAELDPDLSACEYAQAGEFDEEEQPACADLSAVPTAQAGASAGREELADLL